MEKTEITGGKNKNGGRGGLAKNGGLMAKVQKIRAKALKTYYGNPLKDMKLVAITGATGKTTVAHYVHEILKSAGEQVAVLSIGPIGNTVESVVQELETKGLHIAHYDMRFLKPIDEELLEHVGRHFQRIITVEDGVIRGGLGSAVLEYMADHRMHPTVTRLGLPDEFVEHGSPAELYHIVGLDAEGIRRAILSPTEH